MPDANLATARARILGHRGAVLWFTGLSGAGKSTLARGLERDLLDARVLAAVVDGDELRRGLSRGLGFTAEDRRENMRRAAALAVALAEAGVVVIVALISPFAVDREQAARIARERHLPFAEVHLNAPLEVCERRDPKGLYRDARAGQLGGMTGVDSPYEAPQTPDLVLATAEETEERCREQLKALALRLSLPA